MRIIMVKDKEAMGKRAADMVQDEMARHPNPVIGLATGSTPLPLYQEGSALQGRGAGLLDQHHVQP